MRRVLADIGNDEAGGCLEHPLCVRQRRCRHAFGDSRLREDGPDDAGFSAPVSAGEDQPVAALKLEAYVFEERLPLSVPETQMIRADQDLLVKGEREQLQVDGALDVP